jgi:F-type H+-transporting ATPase subunit delta
MHLTIDKNREAYLIPALTALIEKVERFQKKIVADVTSASELDTKQVATLKDELSKKLDKKVELSVTVDPSLIGGPYIRVGGYLMDLTVKMRLHELSAGMKEGWGV